MNRLGTILGLMAILAGTGCKKEEVAPPPPVEVAAPAPIQVQPGMEAENPAEKEGRP